MPQNLLFGQVIRSTSYDEGEIIRSIHELYMDDWFDLDPCYSIGNFYKNNGIKSPKLKFDINPQARGVQQASAEKLPLENESVNSIMFDPPFIISSGESLLKPKKGSNIISSRFYSFPTAKILWDWYNACLIEFYRLLKQGGYLYSNVRIPFRQPEIISVMFT
jgi:hypothetical protein